MRHLSVISGHLISTGFRRLIGCQWDPRVGASHFFFVEYNHLFEKCGGLLVNNSFQKCVVPHGKKTSLYGFIY